jgi:HEAT repeat protein
MVLEVLSGPDPAAAAITVGQIEGLSPAGLKPLAANLEKLPVASQVLVLGALAARRDRSQLPVALNAAKSGNETIRRAGILALGSLGDVTVIGQLLETLYAGGNLAGPAGDSLAQLAGEEVNAKLIAALDGEKKPERISALIGILQRRKAGSAVPVLLQAARSDNAAIRGSAFDGLRTLAEPKNVPGMVLAMLQTARGKERDQAEQAIVAVCSQVAEPDKRAEPILALLGDQAKDRKADLLPLLGRLGGPQVLQLVQQALTSGNTELFEAGLTALCNWPDPSVSEELLKLAQGAKQPGDRLRALQAVIRINTTQPVDRPNEQRLTSLAALKKAMELAGRAEERRAILQGIGFVRTLDTLRYVLPYLDDKDLNQSACKAVVELAHSRTLREPNQAEFNPVLDRVIGLCKDKGLVERARQYRQGR